MELADKETCTGCAACAYVCPKQCISFKTEDSYGISYPLIDNSLCINCERCRSFCPALNPLEKSKPLQAYAAYSADMEERQTSASGGIATEIYKYAVKNGWEIVGAAFHNRFEVQLKLADNIKAINDFKNSKYVFSSTGNIYKDIDSKLKAGHKIVIIALPCQIAAIKKVFHKYSDNLLLVDLVCHGVTPPVYLEQYIHHIESKCNKVAASISFRDPNFGTQNYALSFYDMNGSRFYSSTSLVDIYQFAYHRMVAYRENCYHCRYANSKRSGDITIGDYHGLGQSAPCSFSSDKVSCILVNTIKGNDWLNAMIDKKQIVALNRPIEEPINGDSQLRHPSLKSYQRRLFERKYNGDFVCTVHKIYRITIFMEYLFKVCRFPLSLVRRFSKHF